ncbi:ALQxL family class IV lanthipeptide [Streptomyces sp. NPDC019396]
MMDLALELDLDALQELPAEEEQAALCVRSCKYSCPATCTITSP